MPSIRVLRFAISTLILGGLSLVLSANGFAAPVKTIQLNHGWEFHQATDLGNGIAHSKWYPATVPGDIPLDLIQNKLISDAKYKVDGNNPKWLTEANWEYHTTIPSNASLLNRDHLDLVFDGIDTCAQVFLNGNLLLSPDNMFRTYRVNVKPYLKTGNNQLLVRINAPMSCANRNAAQDLWQKQIKVAPKQYLRKAAVNWNTGGIWRPVSLEAWDDARIANVYIEQPDISTQSAHLLARVEIDSSIETPATVNLSYSLHGKTSAIHQVLHLHPGVNVADVPVNIQHPDLWYPAGYGAQPLYQFQVSVSVHGVAQDSAKVRTGLRSVELRQTPDQWGRTFEFVVNGIPIFAKGADITPLTKFFNAVTPQRIRGMLQSVKDANMNMIRIWGGGIYKPSEFYEVCDELGIMVWQDMMFYNPWQPGNYEFKQNVSAEITDQLKRLRNHPSLVLWCGNNEEENNYVMDSEGHNVDGTPVDPMGRLQMWTDYLTVFSGIIPTLVARYDPKTPYWPSSPSGDYAETKHKDYWILEDGDDVGGNEEFGDTHDYTIPSSNATGMPRKPFSVELDRHYRFVSEYGFVAFPDMRTVTTYTTPQQRADMWKEFNEGGNRFFSGIHDYMWQYYGKPKNLADLVYGSQVLQAEFTKMYAEHLRRDRPRSMGSLFWDLNNDYARGTPSYGSLDYDGRWKALQYYARRFYAPILVSPRVKNGALYVSVVSDETKPVEGTLRVRIMKFDGTVLKTQTEHVTIPPLASKVDLQIPSQPYANPDTVAAMDLTVDGKRVSSNLAYFVPLSQIHLPTPQIQSRWSGSNGTFELRLTSSVLARSVFVSFGDANAKLSDNYFDLLPNESVTITVTGKASLSQLQSNLKLMTVADAFEPNSVWKPASQSAATTASASGN